MSARVLLGLHLSLLALGLLLGGAPGNVRADGEPDEVACCSMRQVTSGRRLTAARARPRAAPIRGVGAARTAPAAGLTAAPASPLALVRPMLR